MGGIAKYILLAGTILLSLQQSHCQDRSIDPDTQRQIDDFIQNVYLPASGVSGMGLAVVSNDGELMYTTGYGSADEARGIENGNATQFLIASITKSFTATLVTKILHETFPDMGEAVLDTPIRQLIPQFNFTLIDRFRSEHATFRDLLAHRLCLARDEIHSDGDSIDTVDELVYRSRYIKEVCGIRGEAGYSNQMYVIAGELAALLVNKPFHDAFQDLLNDIGMTESAFVKKTDDFSRMPFRAMPYYVRNGETHPFNPELIKRDTLHSASGGLYSPPNDMAKFMRFHLNLGNIDGRQVIPQEVIHWLRKPSSLIPGFAFKTSDEDMVYNLFGYGLGLMQASYDGWELIQHGGFFNPYTNLMSWFPAKNLGIFTTTNMGPEQADQQTIHEFIFDLLRGQENAAEMAMKRHKVRQLEKEMKKSETRNEFEEFYKNIVEKAPNQLEIVGKYGSGSVGDCEVSERFNNETNMNEYYFAFGKWLTGWLREAENGAGAVFHLVYDTDIIQDEYAIGLNGNNTFVGFDDNETLYVFSTVEDFTIVRGTFKLGVSLETLPPIPWAPDSC